MAFDDELAARVRQALVARSVAFQEKRMMGGLCFMVDGKMCLGIQAQRLMARIGPEVYEAALRRAGCAAMDFTGRPLRGFVFVSPSATRHDRDLADWFDLALEFNPRAKASASKRAVNRPRKVKRPPTKRKHSKTTRSRTTRSSAARSRTQRST